MFEKFFFEICWDDFYIKCPNKAWKKAVGNNPARSTFYLLKFEIVLKKRWTMFFIISICKSSSCHERYAQPGFSRVRPTVRGLAPRPSSPDRGLSRNQHCLRNLRTGSHLQNRLLCVGNWIGEFKQISLFNKQGWQSLWIIINVVQKAPKFFSRNHQILPWKTSQTGCQCFSDGHQRPLNVDQRFQHVWHSSQGGTKWMSK